MKKNILKALLFIILLNTYIFSAPFNPKFNNDPEKIRHFKALQEKTKNRLKYAIQYNKKTAIKNAFSYPSTNGAAKICVILLQFSDQSALSQSTKINFEKLLFSQNSSDNSLNNYYKTNSYNSFSIQGTTADIYGWFTSTKTMGYYGDNTYYGTDNKHTEIYNMIKEAVQLADPIINFKDYDSNNDGIVDHLLVIHAGNDEADGGSSDIWSHAWFINGESTNHSGAPSSFPTNDNVSIINYVTVSEKSPLGILAHEFGHDLGAVDLYQTMGSNASIIGKWGIMDWGLWLNDGNSPACFSVWHKILLGWITPQTVSSYLPVNNFHTIYDTPLAYKIIHSGAANPDKEYFLVSNRQKKGLDGYIPGGGVLVWHIDEQMGTLDENDIQNYTHPRVKLVTADNMFISRSNSGSSTNTFKDNYDGISATTTPDNSAYNGNKLSVPLISAVGPSNDITTITFLGTPLNEPLILLSIQNYLVSTENVSISWSVNTTNNTILNSISNYLVTNYTDSNNIRSQTVSAKNTTLTLYPGQNSILIKALDSNGNIITYSKLKNIFRTYSSETVNNNNSIILVHNNSPELNSFKDSNGQTQNSIILKSTLNDSAAIVTYTTTGSSIDYLSFKTKSNSDTCILGIKLKNNTNYLTLSSINESSQYFQEIQNNFQFNSTYFNNNKQNIFNVNLYDSTGLLVESNFNNYFSNDAEIYFQTNLAYDELIKYNLLYYSTTNKKWESLDNVTQYNSGLIKGSISHFSTIMLSETNFSEPNELNKLIIYPNPYIPNDGNFATGSPFDGTTATGIKFFISNNNVNYSLPKNSVIQIYTISGEHITSINASENNYTIWNGKNNNGEELASGMYLVLLKSNLGKLTSKLSIIR